MRLADYLPDPLLDAGAFLRTELADYPGRVNVMLRCVLTSAIVIVASMALEVPSLALSLLVVFYVTQSNVVITRLVGIMFMLGSTLAIGISILLLKFTFDYPLIRIVVASVLFFCSVYLMRVLKVGPMFFIVAIVVIYVQTFVDQTDQAELLIRAVLWVWVAVNYPIALTLLVNTLLLPSEPQRQLKEAMHRQLMTVDAHLAYLLEGGPTPAPLTPTALQQGALSLQKLLRFAAMRDAGVRQDQASQLARVATVSRLYRGASELTGQHRVPGAAQLPMMRELRANCRALDEAIAADQPYRFVTTVTAEQREAADLPAAAGELYRALHAFSDLDAAARPAGKPAEKEPMVAPDAFTNPAYARFSLKTLLGVLICYVFYNSTDWQGIHTIMLTCVIVALPSLGASTQRAVLRVGGAVAGSALALFMVVFVIPHLDDIIGLLLMALPVVAFGAWIAGGSERVAYAGIQLVFTFSLALLEQFGPTTNLTDIRDRMVGILLGVGVSTVIQMSFWREGEADALRQKLASMLRPVAALLRTPLSAAATPEQLAYAQQELRTWGVLADCEAMLARVALEPGWQEGEQAQLTLRAQTVLAQGREIMLAGNALHNALGADEARLGEPALNAVRALQAQAAAALERYADDLAANPPVAHAPRRVELATLAAQPLDGPLVASARHLARQVGGLPDWRVAPRPLTTLREAHGHDEA
ncbi:multidrug transporter [Paraburkholderia ginsengiterrae]|uniref:Multidrug transporter n=1 Tax=Paraburkholderia ginsengiterrae TaxID=1462993 RepID=A0ABX2UPG3_9BURK|nr:FUSC family protein [Paraburkholderia ginsengiterrae]OAJ55066.1 multidrug transporter [Paraburkholderia ginsengiterrae]